MGQNVHHGAIVEGYKSRQQLEGIITVPGRRPCGFKLDYLTLLISVPGSVLINDAA